MRYAPIEKNIFLTLQYLINILSSIDDNIKHYMIFYAGYFIYSSMMHTNAHMLYDYFFGV